MTKPVLTAIAAISLAAVVPAAAQQGGPTTYQPAAGQTDAHGKSAEHANKGDHGSFKFTSDEVKQMQDELRQVQRALKDKGYSVGEVDGIGGFPQPQAGV